MKHLHMVSFALLWVGGLNWGLVGLFKYNLVNSLFGSMPALEMLVYVLMGAAAVYTLATHTSYCMNCNDKKK